MSRERVRGLLEQVANGTLDVSGRRKLEGYMAAREINTSVVSFINGAGFGAERARAASFFNVPK